MAKRRPRRRQSPLDQIERLANGRCPVHGLFMPQVAGWYQLPGDTANRARRSFTSVRTEDDRVGSV